jgi:hypothetical protein
MRRSNCAASGYCALFRSANRFYNAPNAFKAAESAWSKKAEKLCRVRAIAPFSGVGRIVDDRYPCEGEFIRSLGRSDRLSGLNSINGGFRAAGLVSAECLLMRKIRLPEFVEKYASVFVCFFIFTIYGAGNSVTHDVCSVNIRYPFIQTLGRARGARGLRPLLF